MAISLKMSLLIVPSALAVWYILRKFRNDSFDTESLKGKNVIITGASSGIGEQMAYWYSRHGANVFLTARREGLLEKVVTKCAELGGPSVKAGYAAGDMGLEADRENAIKEAREFFDGEIDQLILNHAASPHIGKWTGSREQVDNLEKIMNVNFMAYVHLTGLALPSLTKSQGSVGVVGSIVGRFPLPYVLDYDASKFAIDGFFSGLRHEFNTRKQNVSITVVTLGSIATDGAADVVNKLTPLSKSPDMLKNAMGNAASAEDAADMIGSATTRRQAELYYPRNQFVWPQAVLRSLWPQIPEYLGIF